MAKSVNLTYISLKFLGPNLTITPLFLFVPPTLNSITKTLQLKPYSTTPTSYPLQYDMIISRPAQSHSPHQSRRRLPQQIASSKSDGSPESEPDSELGFNHWVDKQLTASAGDELKLLPAMDESKRKYYDKRRKRMYGGSDSDEDGNLRNEDGYVELKPQVVEFGTLHKQEEELHFYEKDKHYKMLHQLEKKYFPDQGFNKAFLEPGGESNETGKISSKQKSTIGEKKENDIHSVKDVKVDVTEKKVEEFVKCLKKVPNTKTEAARAEPYVATRSTGLPPKWDSPTGTVVLVNKPKGWTSFDVCGKLRRLVKVKKVGHAGTLDPMATGLLIVCVGKATKVVDRYQGMTKGYSGIFRLGEATSTLDADSPVIQHELWEHIKDEDIKKAAASFCGEIWQVPPMFSAIKCLCME